eukprot:g8418.t1
MYKFRPSKRSQGYRNRKSTSELQASFMHKFTPSKAYQDRMAGTADANSVTDTPTRPPVTPSADVLALESMIDSRRQRDALEHQRYRHRHGVLREASDSPVSVDPSSPLVEESPAPPHPKSRSRRQGSADQSMGYSVAAGDDSLFGTPSHTTEREGCTEGGLVGEEYSGERERGEEFQLDLSTTLDTPQVIPDMHASAGGFSLHGPSPSATGRDTHMGGHSLPPDQFSVFGDECLGENGPNTVFDTRTPGTPGVHWQGGGGTRMPGLRQSLVPPASGLRQRQRPSLRHRRGSGPVGVDSVDGADNEWSPASSFCEGATGPMSYPAIPARAERGRETERPRARAEPRAGRFKCDGTPVPMASQLSQSSPTEREKGSGFEGMSEFGRYGDGCYASDAYPDPYPEEDEGDMEDAEGEETQRGYSARASPSTGFGDSHMYSDDRVRQRDLQRAAEREGGQRGKASRSGGSLDHSSIVEGSDAAWELEGKRGRLRLLDLADTVGTPSSSRPPGYNPRERRDAVSVSSSPASHPSEPSTGDTGVHKGPAVGLEGMLRLTSVIADLNEERMRLQSQLKQRETEGPGSKRVPIDPELSPSPLPTSSTVTDTGSTPWNQVTDTSIDVSMAQGRGSPSLGGDHSEEGQRVPQVVEKTEVRDRHQGRRGQSSCAVSNGRGSRLSMFSTPKTPASSASSGGSGLSVLKKTPVAPASSLRCSLVPLTPAPILRPVSGPARPILRTPSHVADSTPTGHSAYSVRGQGRSERVPIIPSTPASSSVPLRTPKASTVSPATSITTSQLRMRVRTLEAQKQVLERDAAQAREDTLRQSQELVLLKARTAALVKDNGKIAAARDTAVSTLADQLQSLTAERDALAT